MGVRLSVKAWTYCSFCGLEPGPGLVKCGWSVEDSLSPGVVAAGERREVNNEVRRSWSVMSCMIAEFSKSSSRKGTGRGVVQKIPLVVGGRPVITHSTVSSLNNAHHTRYRVSFETCLTISLSLRRLRPIATAERMATPIIRHDLHSEDNPWLDPCPRFTLNGPTNLLT